MNLSGIEWCVYTWTVIHGCSLISPGCLYCYAKFVAEMKDRMTKVSKGGYRKGFRVTEERDRLFDPFKIKERAVIFLSSMGDLFHTEMQKDFMLNGRLIEGGRITREFIELVFQVMNSTVQHVYIVLTKRPHNWLKIAYRLCFTDNIWPATSVESPAWYHRIEALKKLPGNGKKTLSLEPAIAPYDGLEEHVSDGKISLMIMGGESYDMKSETLVDAKIRRGEIKEHKREEAIAEEIERRRQRQMSVKSAIAVKETCKRNGICFFFKQYGYQGSHKQHRLLPDVTVEEYEQILAQNGWANASIDEQIELIGTHPILFRAKKFSEFPEPALSIMKARKPEVFKDEEQAG